MRVDHHGEQRKEEQRGLGVQAVGDEAADERRARRPLLLHVHLLLAARHRTRAQGLDADVEQVGRGRPLERVEQGDRLGNDQADTQQRIGDVDEDAAAHPQRRPGAGAASVGHALAHHHGEIRSRARHRQQVDQRHRQEFRPVHATSAALE
ncbi:hypothetical protein D3C76_1067150 [compost metagenome]